MTFGQAIRSCFRKFVTFRGRASRSEYWYFVLFGFLVSLPAAVIDAGISGAGSGSSTGRPVSGLVSLVLLLPRLAVTVRRLHDVNYSGWFLGGIFIYLTLLIGVVIGFVAYIAGGKPDFASPIGILAIVGFLGLFIWGIWMFVLSVMKGTSGPNKYGEDPLGPNVEVFN